MHKTHSHSVEHRIVSISQPHVRPIVRGKAGKKVEFGAKISISHLAEGYITLARLSWENYNESTDLIGQIESYRERFGYYPASVHADTIYRNRMNRSYCKKRGIRLSGKALGRPKKQTAANREELKAEKKRQRQDELDRIPVEGKFGSAKRKGTLDRIMAKLAHTSESVIHVDIIVLNLDTLLRRLLFWLLLARRGSSLLCSELWERPLLERAGPILKIIPLDTTRKKYASSAKPTFSGNSSWVTGPYPALFASDV